MSINYIKYVFDEYIEKPLDDKTLCNLDDMKDLSFDIN